MTEHAAEHQTTPAHVCRMVEAFAQSVGLPLIDMATNRHSLLRANRHVMLPENAEGVPEEFNGGRVVVGHGDYGPWWHRDIGAVRWLNPPYHTEGQQSFARLFERSSGESIVLRPADLGTRAGKSFARASRLLLFVSGRLSFGGPHAAGAKQPTVIHYRGAHPCAFVTAFGRLGVVLEPFQWKEGMRQ